MRRWLKKGKSLKDHNTLLSIEGDSDILWLKDQNGSVGQFLGLLEVHVWSLVRVEYTKGSRPSGITSLKWEWPASQRSRDSEIQQQRPAWANWTVQVALKVLNFISWVHSSGAKSCWRGEGKGRFIQYLLPFSFPFSGTCYTAIPFLSAFLQFTLNYTWKWNTLPRNVELGSSPQLSS